MGMVVGPVVQAADQVAPPETLQRVEIQGSAEIGRRSELGSQSFVSRQDIERFGGRDLGQVLARAPGVVVKGAGSSAREFSIAGLGSGYTQILLDGNPVPPDFSLASIPADTIESVEIVRSLSADQRTQGIAGTIRIKLRRPEKEGVKRSGKLEFSTYKRYLSTDISTTYSTSISDWRVGLTAGSSDGHDAWYSSADWLQTDTNGQAIESYKSLAPERGRTTAVLLRPTATRKTENGDAISIDGLVQWTSFRYIGGEQFSETLGNPLNVDRYSLLSDTTTSISRISANWKTSNSAETRLETNLAASTSRRRTKSDLIQYLQTEPILFRTTDSDVSDSAISTRGKVTKAIADVSVATGWDLQSNLRSEEIARRDDTSSPASSAYRLDRFSGRTRQLAMFLLVEGEPTASISGSAGLRWEALSTQATADDGSKVNRTSGVISPSVDALWRVPHHEGVQARFSLGRGFRAPSPKDLLPRRPFFVDNSATNPDFSGNPELRPELAWIVNVAVEKYGGVGSKDFDSATVTYRAIDSVVLRDVYLSQTGVWTTTPRNVGDAWSATVTLESKGRMARLVDQWTSVDYQATLAISESGVRALSGRESRRLPGQVPLLLQLTAEYTTSGGLRIGGTSVFESTAWTAVSASSFRRELPRRTIDPYIAWKWGGANIRASVTNLFAREEGFSISYLGTEGSQYRDVRFTGHRTFRLSAEFAL